MNIAVDWRQAMAGDESYAFTYGGVLGAPNASGVYRIFSPRRWICVGEGDDIRQSLYQLLNDSPEWMDRFGPLSFSFERLSPAERAARQRPLTADAPR
jgi:hypothetical protein